MSRLYKFLNSFSIYNLLSSSNPLYFSKDLYNSMPFFSFFSQVKINIDGFFKGNSGPTSHGAIYRGPHKKFLGCFTISIDNQTFFYTKFYVLFMLLNLLMIKVGIHYG